MMEPWRSDLNSKEQNFSLLCIFVKTGFKNVVHDRVKSSQLTLLSPPFPFPPLRYRSTSCGASKPSSPRSEAPQQPSLGAHQLSCSPRLGACSQAFDPTRLVSESTNRLRSSVPLVLCDLEPSGSSGSRSYSFSQNRNSSYSYAVREKPNIPCLFGFSLDYHCVLRIFA